MLLDRTSAGPDSRWWFLDVLGGALFGALLYRIMLTSTSISIKIPSLERRVPWLRWGGAGANFPKVTVVNMDADAIVGAGGCAFLPQRVCAREISREAKTVHARQKVKRAALQRTAASSLSSPSSSKADAGEEF